MARRAGKTGSVDQNIPPGRRAYSAPRLRSFGRLHLATVGQGTGNADGSSGMGLPNMQMTMSDRRAKQNILRVGQLLPGISLFLFDYKPAFQATYGFGRQIGVMADEVQRVMPWAVAADSDGFQRVNYAALGLWPSPC